jgi:hypothetical protein
MGISKFAGFENQRSSCHLNSTLILIPVLQDILSTHPAFQNYFAQVKDARKTYRYLAHLIRAEEGDGERFMELKTMPVMQRIACNCNHEKLMATTQFIMELHEDCLKDLSVPLGHTFCMAVIEKGTWSNANAHGVYLGVFEFPDTFTPCHPFGSLVSFAKWPPYHRSYCFRECSFGLNQAMPGNMVLLVVFVISTQNIPFMPLSPRIIACGSGIPFAKRNHGRLRRIGSSAKE